VIHHRWHPLNDVFVWLSRIGTWGAVWIALGVVLALVLRRPPLLVAVVLADAAAQGLAGLLKTTTGIERPPRRYPDTHALVPVPHDGSFPSGHTASSFACATVLAAAVPKAAPAFYLLALAIGFSRIYDGVHWPLDVAGGAVLGIAIGIGLLIALPRLAASRRRSGRLRRSG
jgi:undecaprenyl-diphosphatase